MKVCFNIHATGHQINSSFCNRTYPRLLLKHKIIKLSFGLRSVNIDKGYDMTDFHDKKMVPNNGLGFICTSSIAQPIGMTTTKKKITLVAGTHRFLLKNSTIKKDLMVPEILNRQAYCSCSLFTYGVL